METIKQVKLGSQGLVIPTIGLGCMGMSKLKGSSIYGEAEIGRASCRERV